MSKPLIPTAPKVRTSWQTVSLAIALTILGAGLCATPSATAQEPALDESCVVSLLNRTAPVNAAGVWVLPNVPAEIGQVRIRATCVDDGVTRGGQSDVFTVPADGVIRIPEIYFDDPLPVPERLGVSAAETVLTSVGQTLQLLVDAHYADGTSSELSSATDGTNYVTTNPAVATVSPDGLVTAMASGTVIISAMNEGASGFLRLQIVLSGDSDGDGIPDDVEVSLGLDPNDPVDALLDPDGDGLTNADEVGLGTDPNAADTDGDGLLDGEEVDLTGTDPVLFDTDGDGLSDGLEIATGSDPLDPASYDLAAALTGLSVRPGSFVLNSNTVLPGEASVALTVEGALLDGTTIDLTSASRGTGYSSSDLLICNFGLENGVVFAGGEGLCTITVTNSGFSTSADGLVQEFTPGAVSAVNLPAYGNSVAVHDGWAFVAGGAGGLTVVDVMDYRRPKVATSLPLPGNANDVVLVGSLAYVAGGEAGVHVVDVSIPEAPAFVASLDTPGTAIALRTTGDHLYVADGAAGLQVIDLSDPVAPVSIGSWDTPGEANGLAIAGALAVVSTHTAPVEIVDVSTPSAPVGLAAVALSETSFDVELLGSLAYVATSRDLRVLDLTDPQAPVDLGSFGANLWMIDLLAAREDLIFTTQVLPITRAPIFDLREDPAAPVFAGRIEFDSLGLGIGDGLSLAADEHFVYMTASAGYEVASKPGSTGATRLLIAQYAPFEDDAGEAPGVAIVAPADGAEVPAETPFEVSLEASDDFGVLDVVVTVDGEPVARDAFRPYRFLVDPPVAGSSFRIGAVARDFGGNQGIAEEITVHVGQPIPRTTVVGSVVDSSGVPLPGATVFSSVGGDALTEPDGTFVLPNVPASAGLVAVFASANVDGVELRGRSDSATPVPNGVTDVGAIEVRPLGLLLTGPAAVIGTSGAPTVSYFAFADFDRDGITDVAAASASSEVAILLGRGDGTFGETIELTGPSIIRGLDSSDLDQDGFEDLILLENRRVRAYLGQGDGSVIEVWSQAIPFSVDSMAAGDLDLDGVLDLVVAGSVEPTVLVLRGNADGTFSTPESVAVADGPRGLGLADFDGDGRLDLVAEWDLRVALGDGAGGFGPSTALLPGGWVSDFDIGDLDGDGLPDLFVMHKSSSSSDTDHAKAFISNGDGTFLPVFVYSWIGDVSRLTLGDVNLDGSLDAVFSIENSSTDPTNVVGVLLGPETFRFDGSPNYTDAGRFNAGHRPFPVDVASIDIDGLPDLIVGRDAGLSVFSGDGAGGFRSYERDQALAWLFAPRLYPADLDGDGLEDLVNPRTRLSFRGVSLRLQNPDGTFRDGAEQGLSEEVRSLAIADLDRDGVLDVAALGFSTMSVLLNAGDGTLLPPVEVSGQSGMRRSKAADVTGDGFVDVVATTDTAVGVFANDGSGSLVATFTSVGGTIKSFDISDFDQDGDRDLVLVRCFGFSNDCEVVLAANTGTGAFSVVGRLPIDSGTGSSGPGTRKVLAADLDRDGFDDLILVHWGRRDASVFRGLGGGSFSAEVSFDVGVGPVDHTVVDLDFDGILDLLVVNEGSNDLSFLRGNGDGTFAPQERYTTGGEPDSLALLQRAGRSAPTVITVGDPRSSGSYEISFIERQ